MGPRQQARMMYGAFSALQAVRQETAMANVPPAHVWRITRDGVRG